MLIQYSKRISQISEYAFAKINKKVAELKSQGIKVIDFGVGDPKSPTPEFVINSLSHYAEQRKTSGYPSYIGELSYRQVGAEYIKQNYGVVLNPETEICSTIGSKEAVFHFPFGFIDANDIVICPTPGYPVYKTGTEFAGGVAYNVPLLEENQFLIDFESIPEDIANKAKIIWTNYPNSPTGVSAPLSWLEQLVSWAHKYNVIIAADEGCYNDIYFDHKPHSILEITKEGIITFYSLSKRNNMTGYRVGFVAGDQQIIEGFKLVKTNIDSGTPTFIQDAAALALKDIQHNEQMREEYRQKRNILLPALKEAGLPAISSDTTFYLWQKAPQGMTGMELAEKLIGCGIVVTPGSAISNITDGINPGEYFVRIALTPSINDVKEAAKRIKEQFRK